MSRSPSIWLLVCGTRIWQKGMLCLNSSCTYLPVSFLRWVFLTFLSGCIFSLSLWFLTHLSCVSLIFNPAILICSYYSRHKFLKDHCALSLILLDVLWIRGTSFLSSFWHSNYTWSSALKEPLKGYGFVGSGQKNCWSWTSRRWWCSCSISQHRAGPTTNWRWFSPGLTCGTPCSTAPQVILLAEQVSLSLSLSLHGSFVGLWPPSGISLASCTHCNALCLVFSWMNVIWWTRRGRSQRFKWFIPFWSHLSQKNLIMWA